MSDFTRLEEKLAKLRGRDRAPGEPRLLAGSDVAERIGAVVTEIDETILPRRLTFAVEGGEAVHLAVANRRLQALLAPVPTASGVDTGDMAGKPLADAEDANLSRLHDLLKQVLVGTSPVRIDAMRAKDIAFGSDVGIRASMLTRVWNVSAPTEKAPVDPEDAMATFIDGLAEDALAWLRIEGEEVTDQGGDEAKLEALGEQAAVFLDGYFSKFDALYPDVDGPVATMIAPLKDGPAVFFGEIGGLSVFVAVKPGCAPALARRWQSLVIG